MRPMLAYDDRGTGRPLVFLHGITCDMAHWGPVAELLAGDFRCVRIDLPGHGESGGDGVDLFAQVAAVREVVDHLDLGEPLLVGHSAGGMTSVVYALIHPVSGVIVVDQPLDVGQFGAGIVEIADELRDPATFERAFFGFIQRFRPDLVPEERQALLLDHVRPRHDVVMTMWDPFFTTPLTDLTAQIAAALPGLAAPFLTLYADEPPAGERELLDLIPDVTVETWDGLGHFMHLADPPRLADRIREFAGRVFHDSRA